MTNDHAPNEEVSVFDVVDALYLGRLWVLGGLVLGLAVAAWSFFSVSAPPSQDFAVVSVYEGGTPAQNQVEIVNQLQIVLAKAGYLVASQSPLVLSVKLDAPEDAGKIKATTGQFEDELLVQVRENLASMETFAERGQISVELLLAYKNYLQSVQAGRIDLVSLEISSRTAPGPSRTGAALLSVFVGLGAGMALAVLSGFFGLWSKNSKVLSQRDKRNSGT